MRICSGIVALAACGTVVSHAQAGRIIDSFDHAPQAMMELWVGQPSHGAPNIGTALWRGRLNDVLGGFRGAALEHVSSSAGHFVRISEGDIQGALIYDGGVDSGAILRLEYSTGGSMSMDLSAPSERYLEIDMLYADRGGVVATVELISGVGPTQRASFLISQSISSGAQMLRFDLGGVSTASLSATDMLRVTFDAGSMPDTDYAIGEIRLVPAPASVVLGCAGVVVMAPARRRRRDY